MKVFIFAIFMVLILSAAVSNANAADRTYNTPTHNYYQNNWMR